MPSGLGRNVGRPALSRLEMQSCGDHAGHAA